jgi:hypothetical protein
MTVRRCDAYDFEALLSSFSTSSSFDGQRPSDKSLRDPAKGEAIPRQLRALHHANGSECHDCGYRTTQPSACPSVAGVVGDLLA